MSQKGRSRGVTELLSTVSSGRATGVSGRDKPDQELSHFNGYWPEHEAEMTNNRKLNSENLFAKAPEIQVPLAKVAEIQVPQPLTIDAQDLLGTGLAPSGAVMQLYDSRVTVSYYDDGNNPPKFFPAKIELKMAIFLRSSFLTDSVRYAPPNLNLLPFAMLPNRHVSFTVSIVLFSQPDIRSFNAARDEQYSGRSTSFTKSYIQSVFLAGLTSSHYSIFSRNQHIQLVIAARKGELISYFVRQRCGVENESTVK
ncbi:hypothetical protein B0H13DRAFT_1851225 [Mycena leptocephala]|nr:hypothetical protein B0H13DRAFT_1851225 [Mycena leptocephala]